LEARYNYGERLSKEFAKDDEIIARGIEVVHHRLVAVAAGFIQATGRGIGRCARCLYHQHSAASAPHLVFDSRQQGMANTLSPHLRVYSNPVQVEGPFGQRVWSKAGVAQQAASVRDLAEPVFID
jgi:hypothetical protein